MLIHISYFAGFPDIHTSQPGMPEWLVHALVLTALAAASILVITFV
jgi:hypothetical protein